MKPVALAFDHAGFRLKGAVKAALEEANVPYKDYGAHSEERCDYPDYGAPAARSVSEGEADRAILCCGTGGGMAIVANKFPGVRAVACHDAQGVRMSRLHNDANVLALGGRVVDSEEAKQLVRLWLETPFEGGRHARRLSKISNLEGLRETTP